VADLESIDRIAEPILKEYADLFQGLRDTIRAIPAEEWAIGERKGKVPARQACHLLRALLHRSTSWKVKSTDRFEVAAATFSRNVAPDGFPSQQSILEYVDEVEAWVRPWVPELVRQTLSGKRKQHPPLGQAIYILRHSIVHLAYIRREMYERGIPRPGY
jgi:hypothetical protein